MSLFQKHLMLELLYSIIELMIYYDFHVEIPKNPWNPHVSKLWSCDMGVMMKEDFYEIMPVVVGLLELC